MIVTYTAAQWEAFKTGAEVRSDLRAKGIQNPDAATQKRESDGQMKFEEAV